MNKSPAPFFNDIAEGPEQVSAWWLTTSDGLRIRVAYWPCDAAKGTVLMLPGRTEYVEKYGITARDLTARGYAMVSIDWRGQGIADRDLAEKATGHVNDFMDYQHDVQAVRQAVAVDHPRAALVHRPDAGLGRAGEVVAHHELHTFAHHFGEVVERHV